VREKEKRKKTRGTLTPPASWASSSPERAGYTMLVRALLFLSSATPGRPPPEAPEAPGAAAIGIGAISARAMGEGTTGDDEGLGVSLLCGPLPPPSARFFFFFPRAALAAGVTT
jgi:hypothetical protein